MKEIQLLIELFLQINPTPSDAQVHALAAAVGIDKETLEAKIYAMLGEEVADDGTHVEACVCASCGDYLATINGLDTEGSADDLLLIDAASTNDILSGDYDQNTVPAEDLALNDGDMDDDATIEQELTDDDGVLVDDIDDAHINDKDVLKDDGQPEPQIEHFLRDPGQALDHQGV